MQRVSNTCPVRSLDLGHGSRRTGCDAPVRVAGVTLVSWDQSFYGPIELPSGKKLITLRDATHYITKLTKPKHDAEEWQTAIEALLLVAEHGGPTMFAPIGVMRALHRHKPKARPAPRRSTVHGNQAGWIWRIPQRFTAESIQSVDFGSGVEPGSRRNRALRASRIEIKIDRITQKNGDIFQKQLDFLSLVFLRAAFL